ncbi:MFS transporter [Xenorhabdus bovienii]|uniref:MFS transporter n=1 Tax=Xenorhabdus bovienii TaxID=40576 RepID=A0AAJ1N171_XENBV|nr:MFS transporter [Xenorhabdus bovienii]MDE1476921.1 MFS transporter [Xenorhabdus bovienii]MDE1481932.1 MFS transporter [Xenorhabdus bovienii]MDE1485261.1 MFS transporter [Xenorhabdus bovienii]MDE1490801.1 MFS transporter [Xenorhabdus bovienii]MDE1494240.1 MFS transporter [Xenorhabdus bovienii]
MNRSHPVEEQTGNVMRPWLAVTAIGLSTFSVVTTEMLPVGLLNPIADTLNSTVGTAGLMISLPALLAALFAPLAVLASGGINRRTILCFLIILLIMANIASATATSMNWLLAARVIVGFCMGGIWAIAGGLAGRLVSPGSVGLATSIIFGGVAAASVFGVPLGAFIGDAFGWRAAFLAMAILAMLVLILLIKSLPSLPVNNSVTIGQFAEVLANRKVLVGLLVTFFLVAGHFMAYTYVRPLLQTVSKFDNSGISPLLFAYGLAGIAGNFLAGSAATKQLRWTLVFIAIGITAAVLLFSPLGGSITGGSLITLLWGVAYGGVSVSLMTWMMIAASKSIEVATSLYIAIFNIGIASGSFLGSQVVDKYGLLTNTTLAGVVAILALAVLIFSNIKADPAH